jgi:hypothetical protein
VTPRTCVGSPQCYTISMNTYFVLYCMPHEGLAAWAAKPEAERKEEESRLQALWQTWSAEHAGVIKQTAGAGKTKRVTQSGVADAANDVMIYSVVEAESHEAAVALFAGHPHLQIPGAWIDVMPARAM